MEVNAETWAKEFIPFGRESFGSLPSALRTVLRTLFPLLAAGLVWMSHTDLNRCGSLLHNNIGWTHFVATSSFTFSKEFVVDDAIAMCFKLWLLANGVC